VREALEDAKVGRVEAGSSLFIMLESLLAAHPRAAVKLAPGVEGFAVARGRTGREVRILRPDGTEEPLSWRKCCGDGGDTSDIRQSYREAVDDQVAPLRRQAMHVDHVPPMTFERIVRDFEAVHGPATAAEVDHDTLLHGVRFIEPRRSLFAEYHRGVAKLEAIPMLENLTRPRIRGGVPSRGTT
jgi:hypothetical protein